MLLVSTAFRLKALYDGKAHGLAQPRMAVFEHPLGGLTGDEIAQRAQLAYPGLQAALHEAPAPPAAPEAAAADRVQAPSDPALLQQWCFDSGFSEGFPVIAPTPQAVERMVRGAGRGAGDVIGTIAPRAGVATVETIAANAVLAGCRPEHMPILLAATRAMLEPCFNLAAVQPTTHPVAPLLVVHGPIARELGISGGPGAFGPSAMANAVIGRAVRLILWNIGGAVAGAIDRSTQGSPSKFSFCIAENSEATPWAPFVADRGLAPDANAVTVYASEAPHNINDHEHTRAEEFLHVAADAMHVLGSNAWFISWRGRKEHMLVLSPEHAALVAGGGFDRRRIQQWLHRATSRRLAELRRGGMFHVRDWPPELMAIDDDEALVPQVPRPEDILVLVAGGVGRHSATLPSFGCSVSVTRAI